MRVEILSDGPVTLNLALKDPGVACAYPQTTVLENGDAACLYRQGASKHSYDGILMLQRSSDKGATWSEPLVVFDGRATEPPQSVLSGGLCQTRAGHLLVTLSTVDASNPTVYVFSEEAAGFKCQVCAVRSGDLGRTWSDPVVMDTSPFPKAGITTKPFVLRGGEVCAPVEVQTALGPQGTAAVFSSDDGRTFGPLVTCAADPDGDLNLCDARFAALDSGELLMLLWAFLQANERTIDVHRSFSADGGRTWSAAVGTGIEGQICVPLVLGAGRVIAASNHRHPPEGIQLWLSGDDGRTWDADHPLQMWDAREARMLGEPTRNRAADFDPGVWDELEAFTFGTPDLVDLGDGSVLLTYYATLGGIIHVRACRFFLVAGE